MTAFTLYPAIDLKDGGCVRLLRGEMDRATVFNDDPADQARRFARDGFSQLHVVDLDGAFEGRSANEAAVRAILAAASTPVQLGGGIRDLDAVGRWLKLGVSRVILGTAAVRDPALVRDAARNFPGQVAIGIDAREGKVATDGWAETSEVEAVDLARRMEDAGVCALIVTDIARDGAMLGVNLEAVGAVADAVTIPVIASGGVSTTEDVRLLRARPGHPIAGAIIGRALYEGALSPADALAAAS